MNLTHWGWDEIDDILQTTSLNAFPWTSNQQYASIVSDNGLAPTRRQAIIWTNDDYITDTYMRHSASMS